jgi:DNA (cytosine-5)-methyltransferase 1
VDEWALETHAHNFEGLALRLDLATSEARDVVVSLFEGINVDLVAGGPPCQPYSKAGRSKIRSLVESGARSSLDHRRELWRSFLEVVERLQPRAVLLENVPDMALGDGMIIVREIMSSLETAGYETDARLVDAWLHGVPQHRQRLILVAWKGSKSLEWPSTQEQVTLWDAIGDLPILDPEAGDFGAEALPYDGPRSEFQRLARKECVGDEVDIVFDHCTRAVRPDDIEAFRLMRAGTRYGELPENLRRYRADIFEDKYNRLDWDGISRSITAHIAKDGYWYIHPVQHRTLTVREAARIQTFPDSYRFAGSRSHQFAQIGNAVPPALAESMGGALLAAATGARSGSKASRVRWRADVRKRLLSWSLRDSAHAPWAYPTNLWMATVGQVLGGRSDGGWPSPAQFLDLVPSESAATPPMVALIEALADPGPRRKAVRRLSELTMSVRKTPEGWNRPVLPRSSSIGPAAREWIELLSQSLGVVGSRQALRVVSRLTGTDVDRQNQGSSGRMELAKLMGVGDGAARINAAMHRLGADICCTVNPSCGRCPLARLCPSSQS